MKTILKGLILITSIIFFSTKGHSMTDDEIEAAANNPENDDFINSKYLQPLLDKHKGNINEVFLEVCEHGFKNEKKEDLTHSALRALKLLLDKKVNIDYNVPLDFGVGCGETGLHKAIMRRHNAVAIFLINHGANLDIKTYVRGFTPLMRAIIQSNDKLAKKLIEFEADLDIQSDGGYTALTLANVNDREEIVQMINRAPEEREQRKLCAQLLFTQLMTTLLKAKFLELNR